MARQTPATASEAATLIGPGIHVRGRVSGEEDLHIQGQLEGSIVLTETVYVATGGIVVATVQARDVVISGVVVGNVTADDSVTLNAGAKLVGDITAPRIIVADGAAFSGNLAMGGEPPPPRAQRRQAARRATPTVAPAKAGPKTAPKKAAASKPAPAKAAPAKAAPAKADPPPTRVAAIPTPRAARREDDDTIVVKHAEVQNAGKGSGSKSTKKSTKKAPPRARVPKPGKRRVGRR